MSSSLHTLDRVEVTFDDENLVAGAGLVLVASLVVRLGLERLIDDTVRMVGRVGGARPGRKLLTLVHTLIAGGDHIDHADMLRAGSTDAVLGHRVMAPSTIGTFLRSFTFGHLRQLDAMLGEALRRAWAMGAGPGEAELVVARPRRGPPGDHIEELTAAHIDDRCGPVLGSPAAQPGEERLIEAESVDVTDAVGIIHQGRAVGDHGVVDRVPVTAQLDRYLIDRAPVATDLFGHPPPGTVGHGQPGRGDPLVDTGPRPDQADR